jgi:hypothetical protein
MSVKFAVKTAAFASGAVVVLALVTSILIVRDINQLYDEVMADMVEFKDYSNGAWDGMLVFTMPQQREARHIRRQAYAQAGGGGGYNAGGHHGGLFFFAEFKNLIILGGYQQGPAAVHNAGASAFHGSGQNGGSSGCACGRKPNHCPPGPPDKLFKCLPD